MRRFSKGMSSSKSARKLQMKATLMQRAFPAVIMCSNECCGLHIQAIVVIIRQMKWLLTEGLVNALFISRSQNICVMKC